MLCFLSLLLCLRVCFADLQDNSLDEASLPREVAYASFDNSRDSGKIWVLQLSDGASDTLALRAASDEEIEDFEFYTQPLIDNYHEEHSVVKKDAPKSPKPENEDKKKNTAKKPVTKEDIFKYLNKFAMFSKTEADAYLSDSHENDDPSIALYFKGPFTSLIVKQGIRQWHYFLPPPSLLPAWLYEARDAGEQMPAHVLDKFYPPLLRLLQALLRYPL